VGVPGDFIWGNSTQRLTQRCAADTKDLTKPLVGRPGASTLVGCPAGDGGPNPEMLVANTGPVVGFDRVSDMAPPKDQGDRTTVQLDGVLVVVQVPQPLRARIVATIRRAPVDSHGCPDDHPIGANPGRRPASPIAVTTLSGVSAVSACRYRIGAGRQRLLSSVRLEGPAAAAALAEVAKAPLGGGPDEPATCSADVRYGHEVLVLGVRSSAGASEIVLRYAGCDHHGFDDGVAVRTLTTKAVAPFVAGPNTVNEFSGAAMLDILRPSAEHK
jgi:hypothetical protein